VIASAVGVVLLACSTALSTLAAGSIEASPQQHARIPHAPTPVIVQALPVGYDAIADYEAQSLCDASPKPGTRALAALVTKTYGRGQVVGISRGCSIGGTSEHKEGRALDWMTSVRNRQGRANAKAFLSWLLGPDQFGVPYGNATRLGVMYIGWNDRFWAAYATDRGWTELKGCFSTPGAGSDTICHRNHIHISLTWDGASGRTSFWDGTTLTPYCASPRSAAAVTYPGRSADVIAIPPVRVLSTREGRGLSPGMPDFYGWDGLDDGGYRDDAVDPSLPQEPAPEPVPEPVPEPPPAPAPTPTAPCRVHPSGWHGDPGGILTKVTGQGGVPEAGVAAVAVTVTALGSTAPSDISVGATGDAKRQTVATVRMNGRASGSAVVPVASDGTIALGTSRGATDLTVDVTGYYLVGDQPNTTAVALVPATSR
jgi:hypothetical protein